MNTTTTIEVDLPRLARRLLPLIAISAVSFTVAGFAITLLASNQEQQDKRSSAARISEAIEFERRLEAVENVGKNLETQGQQTGAPTDAATNLRLAKVEASQKELEDALGIDPEKSVQLLLLKKDLDALRSQQQIENEALSKRIDQSVDLDKWLIGGVTFSVIASVLNQLFTRRREP